MSMKENDKNVINRDIEENKERGKKQKTQKKNLIKSLPAAVERCSDIFLVFSFSSNSPPLLYLSLARKHALWNAFSKLGIFISRISAKANRFQSGWLLWCLPFRFSRCFDQNEIQTTSFFASSLECDNQPHLTDAMLTHMCIVREIRHNPCKSLHTKIVTSFNSFFYFKIIIVNIAVAQSSLLSIHISGSITFFPDPVWIASPQWITCTHTQFSLFIFCVFYAYFSFDGVKSFYTIQFELCFTN